KKFALGTEYQAVIEYMKLAGERFRNVRAYYIDQTGVGEAFPENARRAGVKNVKGIELSLPRKSDVMTQMKQVMEQKRLHIPRDRELIIEMNAEIAKLTEAGKTKFHHRSGTHDDILWALALAVYASRHEIPPYIRSQPSDTSASIHGTDPRSSIRSQAPPTIQTRANLPEVTTAVLGLQGRRARLTTACS